MSLVKTFFKTSIFFGLFMVGIFTWLSREKEFGIIVGILAGISFGLTMTAFITYQKKQFKKNRPILFEGEKTVKEGVANHLIKGEAVGGWLYLTDRRLIFRSHKLNFNNHEMQIPLNQIDKVVVSTTLGIFPTAIKIILANGQEYRFVVENRKEWCFQINHLLET